MLLLKNNLFPAVASLVSLTRFEIDLNFSFFESPNNWKKIDSLVVTYPPADLTRCVFLFEYDVHKGKGE
jgi:hypothetical protein